MNQKILRRLLSAITLLLMASSGSWFLDRAALAQAPSTCARWDEPVLVFDGETWTQFTDLAAAPDGTVYGVWTNNVFGDPNAGEGQVGAEDFAIFLAALPGTELNAQPNDIVAHATYPRILFDAGGYMHLFRSQQCLAHSAVPLSDVFSGLAWLKATTTCIDRTRSTFGAAASPNGTLHVAWSDDTAQAVRYAFSEDGGQRWSEPIVVVQARSPGEFVTDVEMTVGNDDSLHIVWAYRCAEGNTCYAVGYSKSEDRGYTWAEPIVLAESKSVQPVVAVYDSQVHAVWNGTVDISKRFHRYSNDRGASWSPTSIVSDGPLGGILGAPGLAIDSDGKVHTVLATGSAILYACWDGQSWSRPVPVRQSVGDVGYPSLIVTEGNRLHAVWHEGVRKIWYATAQLGTPRVETSFPPSRLSPNDTMRLVSEERSPTAAPDLQVTPTSQVAPPLVPDITEPRASLGQSSALLIGILPAALVVIGAVLVLRIRSKRDR